MIILLECFRVMIILLYYKEKMSQQIKTLDEFIEKQGDFYFHFIGGKIGDVYRSAQYFKEFKKDCPEFVDKLTKEITEIVKKKKQYPSMEEFRRNLPNEDLFFVYDLMYNTALINGEEISM